MARLAGRIAHQLNNLLTVVHGSASHLLEDISDGSVEERLHEIEGACRAGARLTSDMLSISGNQWGAARLVDLRTVLSGMGVDQDLPEGVQLRLEAPADPCLIRADPSHVEGVVRAVLDNSLEALDGKGKIRVTVHSLPPTAAEGEAVPGWIRLKISDDGPGMDRDTLVRACEPYFTTRLPADGRGLGLAIARGLVHQSSGHLEISSSPGVGTSVEIGFPAA